MVTERFPVELWLSIEACKAARDARARELRKMGYVVTVRTLRGEQYELTYRAATRKGI